MSPCSLSVLCFPELLFCTTTLRPRAQRSDCPSCRRARIFGARSLSQQSTVVQFSPFPRAGARLSKKNNIPCRVVSATVLLLVVRRALGSVFHIRGESCPFGSFSAALFLSSDPHGSRQIRGIYATRGRYGCRMASMPSPWALSV
jgi:hypothetical protein